MAHDPLDDDETCGRLGCRCDHRSCDRGFRYTHDPERDREVVTPCPECKPETVDAALRASSRAEFLRLARRVESFR